MKKALVILAVMLFAGMAHASEETVLEKPVVDRRVELLSIVFRLVEKREYSQTYFKTYTDRIDNHFGAYKDHKLIRFTRKIAKKRGIAYNAPMAMAVSLDNNLELLTYDTGDDRWDRKSIEQFVPLLRQFAEDSDFDRFFAENADLYAVVLERFRPVYEAFDREWYHAFYGTEPNETFTAIVAPGNGGDNYGATPKYPDGSKKCIPFLAPLW